MTKLLLSLIVVIVSPAMAENQASSVELSGLSNLLPRVVETKYYKFDLRGQNIRAYGRSIVEINGFRVRTGRYERSHFRLPKCLRVRERIWDNGKRSYRAMGKCKKETQ